MAAFVAGLFGAFGEGEGEGESAGAVDSGTGINVVAYVLLAIAVYHLVIAARLARVSEPPRARMARTPGNQLLLAASSAAFAGLFLGGHSLTTTQRSVLGFLSAALLYAGARLGQAAAAPDR